MRPANSILALMTLLLLSPVAWANVARGYYEDDADYPVARARAVAMQVALVTIPLVGLYWVYYRSVHSQRGPGARLLLTLGRLAVVAFLWLAASIPFLGSGPVYFLAGSRPPPQPGKGGFLFGPDPSAPQKSTVPETVAGTALSLAIIFGGLWWLRRQPSAGGLEPQPAEPS